jgi:hypothetical protein
MPEYDFAADWWNSLTPAEREQWEAEEERDRQESARRDRECGREIVTGSVHDPYGVECDLPRGHDGRHEGVVMDDVRIKWGPGAY